MLPLRDKPTPPETIPSLLSRLAAVNGCGPGQFAHEMGFSLKRIVTQKLLNALLTEAGAFEPHDRRSPRQKIFAAELYSELLEEIPYLVGKQAMQRAIGATEAELQTLEADGVLVPRSKLSSVRSPWSTRDGQKLLDQLSLNAIEIPAESESWTTLQSARLRSGYSLDRLLAEVTAGTLCLGKREHISGYHSFVVSVSDLEKFLPVVEQKDRDDGLIPAATFGRSIGLRGKGTFLAFVEDGHTPSQLAGDPKTGQIRHYLSPADIAAFHERFLTLTTLVSETGQHRNTALAALKPHVDARFTSNGRDYGPIYLRACLLDVLLSLRQQAKAARR